MGDCAGAEIVLMNVDFLAQIAQIVAAVGVIVSLVYVGVQIRQATRATKLASIQAVEAAIGRTEELIIQDGSFAEILKRGLTASGAAQRVLSAHPARVSKCALSVSAWRTR
jgi:DNA-binding protein H-NS